METREVLAVVVSYNGSRVIRETVAALRPQVGRILVVDNGSSAETGAVLDDLERNDCTVVRLGANRGIGCALNVGVRHAREHGFTWLLTMDQDTTADTGLVEAYRHALSMDPGLVCVAPGQGRPAGKAAYAITSGNCVRVSLYDAIGLYDEGFFIDCIDFDFSLRLRAAGYDVVRVPEARMRHRLGEPVVVRGIWGRFYARHAPGRRYYMQRNYMYMAERYLLRFPGFILKLGVLQVVLAILVGFLDPHPGESYRAMLRGLRDYLARRQGPDPEPAR